jgi:outer membrane protein assembly complex protein YaeT
VKKRSFDPAVFRADQARIVELYRLAGYRSAAVVSSRVESRGEGEGLNVLLVVDEGPVTTVEQLTWAGLDTLVGSHVKKVPGAAKLKEGSQFLPGAVPAEQRRALGLLGEDGYPLARVTAETDWSGDSTSVKLTFAVNAGPRCWFGPTTFAGLQNLRQGDLARSLSYKEGKLFRRSRLQETRQQLYSHGLVKYAAVSLADTVDSGGRLPITFRVRESPLRYIKTSVGFGSQDRLRGRVTLGHRNLLGGARNLEGTVRASWWYQEAAVRLRQPQWPWPRHTFGSGAYLRWEREESYRARVLGSSIDLSRRSGRHTRASLSYGIERITFFGDTEEVEQEMGDAYRNPSLLATLQATVARDSRPEPFWPTSGSASRLTIEAPGLLLRTDYRYVKAWVEWSHFRQVWRGTVLAARLGAGTIKPLESGEVVPVPRRFYCGGTHSVRGFSRRAIGPKDAEGNPIGGQTLLEGSLEVRFPIVASVGGVAFADRGGLWPGYLEVRRKDLEWSAGLGVRVSTPVGPLSADLAWDVSRPLNRRSLRLHLMVGQAF